MVNVAVEPARAVFFVQGGTVSGPDDGSSDVPKSSGTKSTEPDAAPRTRTLTGPFKITGDTVRLTVRNTQRSDSIVFAVRTTAPAQFVVKNKEGTIPPKGSTVVTLKLRRSSRTLSMSARFLVQCALLTAAPAFSDSDEEERPPGCSSDSSKRAKVAAGRLGKEWRGRNLDLFDCASVVVPCVINQQPPQLASLQEQIDAVTDDVAAAVRRRDEVAAALKARQEAKVQLQAVADKAATELDEVARRKPPAAKFNPRAYGGEAVAMLMFLSSTALLALHL